MGSYKDKLNHYADRLEDYRDRPAIAKNKKAEGLCLYRSGLDGIAKKTKNKKLAKVAKDIDKIYNHPKIRKGKLSGMDKNIKKIRDISKDY
jgi:hypothetical protein